MSNTKAFILLSLPFVVCGLRHESVHPGSYQCQDRHGHFTGNTFPENYLCDSGGPDCTPYGSDELHCEGNLFIPECNEVFSCNQQTGYCAMTNHYGSKQFEKKCHCVEVDGVKKCPTFESVPDHECNVVLSKHVDLIYEYNDTVIGQISEGSAVVASCDFVNEKLTNGDLEWTELTEFTCVHAAWKMNDWADAHTIDLTKLRCVLNRETSCNNSQLNTLYLGNTCYVLLMDRKRTWQEALNHCKHIEWYNIHEFRQPHLGFVSTKEIFDEIYAELQNTKYASKFSWHAVRQYGDGIVERNESFPHPKIQLNYTTLWIGLKTGPFRWRFSENSREVRSAEQPMWLDRESNHEQLDDCTYMQMMKFGDEPSGFRSSKCTEKRYALCQLFDEQ